MKVSSCVTLSCPASNVARAGASAGVPVKCQNCRRLSALTFLNLPVSYSSIRPIFFQPDLDDAFADPEHLR
jgi:hypothetical protein